MISNKVLVPCLLRYHGNDSFYRVARGVQICPFLWFHYHNKNGLPNVMHPEILAGEAIIRRSTAEVAMFHEHGEFHVNWK